MSDYLNLREGKFPIKIDKFDIKFSDDLSLGILKNPLIINLSIDKLSSEIFICKGIIKSSFIESCQSCLKDVEVKLSVDTNLIIKDTDILLDKSTKSDESHYQNLKYFQIKKLIEEEICLNYPSIIRCEEQDCIEFKEISNEKKIQPFQKIRDLIE